MNSLNNIKAVIFDWAGTIVDYGCIAPSVTFLKVFKEYGIEISINDVREPMGLAKKDHIRAIANLPHVKVKWMEKYKKNISDDTIEILYRELETHLEQVVKYYATPIPGSIELFQTLHERDIKIGTTTGYVDGMMKQIVPFAEEKGLKPDSIVSSSEVRQGRPYPWMCFQNAEKLNVFPMDHMVKIGDTVADIEEGINAGMWTIGLTKSGNEVGLTQEEIGSTDAAIVREKIEKAGTKLLAAGAHYIAEGVWDCLPLLMNINERLRNNEKP